MVEVLATILAKEHLIFSLCSAPGYGHDRVLTTGTQNCKPRQESRGSVGLWLGRQGNPLVCRSCLWALALSLPS